MQFSTKRGFLREYRFFIIVPHKHRVSIFIPKPSGGNQCEFPTFDKFSRIFANFHRNFLIFITFDDYYSFLLERLTILATYQTFEAQVC